MARCSDGKKIGIFVSDSKTITDGVNDIVKSIKSTSFASSKVSAVGSGRISTLISGYLNRYYNYMNNLLEDLYSETDAIMSIVKAICDFDAAMAAGVDLIEK